MKQKEKLGYQESENDSGFNFDETKIETLDFDSYEITNIFAGGDNPKKVITHKEVYQNRRNKNTIYIAKTAGKWYPNESISEYLIYKIGVILGFNVAESKLVMAENQLRLLSKFFRNSQQELTHGLDYLVNSGKLGAKSQLLILDKRKDIRNTLTLQMLKDILKTNFPSNYEKILNDFINLLIFDAYVGNNDRHHENWAIISHIGNKHLPYFSPIYDTARGIFWNESEEKLNNKFYPPNRKITSLEKYANNAFPKIGWENKTNLNHFQLFELIVNNECGITKRKVKNILAQKKLDTINDIIDNEFQDIISKERAEIIKAYLKIRRDKLWECIK